MTKILNIVTGEYIVFLSSIKYDMKHPLDSSEDVIVFEDSYYFETSGMDILDYINSSIRRKEIGKYCDRIDSLDELEIVYD